jgi:hypothetical protein
VALRRGVGKVVGGWMGEEVWGLLSFISLLRVWVYFCCYSGGCLCKGLQGARVLYSWYSRLVCGC